MTTKTQLSDSIQSIPRSDENRAATWPWILAAIIVLSLISIAILVSPTAGGELNSSERALEAISARYQGMAELYAARQEVEAQRALEILSSRYQSRADLYAAWEKAEAGHALRILTARYQGMADMYNAARKAETMRALEIISARYQGQADLYQGGEK